MGADTPTLSMRAIAELAQVKRPVVSVWRTRYADSAYPFPAPVSEQPLRFDASEVAAWLAARGLGNNSQVVVEKLLHADVRTRLFADPEATSTQLLQLAQGGPVTAEIREFAQAAGSPMQALDLLMSSLTQRDGAWAAEALTDAARELLGTLIAQRYRSWRERPIIPLNEGGQVLIDALLPQLHPGERPAFGFLPGTPNTAAWRRLRSHGFPVALALSPALYLASWQDAPGPQEFLEQVAEWEQALSTCDELVVIGPAAALTQQKYRREMATLPSFATELPAGLSRFGGRRRLALWDFNPDANPAQVAVGAYAGRPSDAACGLDLAADIATPSCQLSAEQFRGQRKLDTLTEEVTGVMSSELLDAYCALGGEEITGLQLRAAIPVSSTIAFEEAGLDLPGHRLPAAALINPRPGAITVLGPAEVRGGQPDRAVEAEVMAETVARMRLSEPGDVIYVVTGGAPAALVDTTGGHLIEAPARMLRCQYAGLLPEVVAADINAEVRRDRRLWRLRLVPQGQETPLRVATHRIRRRREQLHAELVRLDTVEKVLLDALASGGLIEAD